MICSCVYELLWFLMLIFYMKFQQVAWKITLLVLPMSVKIIYYS